MTITPPTTQRLAVSALIEYLRPHLPILDRKITKLVEAVERAFSDTPPRLVQVGDHDLERANYDAVQDAVSSEMEEG